jgi:methyltransferase (TIGR00027 family)
MLRTNAQSGSRAQVPQVSRSQVPGSASPRDCRPPADRRTATSSRDTLDLHADSIGSAFSIAAVRAEELLRPPEERLFYDPYAAMFRAAGAHAEEGTKRFLDLPFFRDVIRLRMRLIDDEFGRALDAGIDQIMLLGAGFDARALRVPAVAARGARVYEINLPGQLERKRALLASGSVALPAWVSYVPCDLTAVYEQELPLALEECGFRRDRPALVIWEGITAYIGVAATDRSLRFMAGFGTSGTRIVFDVGTSFFGSETVTDHALRAGFVSCEAHGGRALAAVPRGRAASRRLGVSHGDRASLRRSRGGSRSIASTNGRPARRQSSNTAASESAVSRR